MALARSVPKRSAFSPPSPELLIAPMAFMARAMVSCASGLREPRLMAPETKRRRMAASPSTSSIGMARVGLKAKRPRRVHRRRAWPSMARENRLNSP